MTKELAKCDSDYFHVVKSEENPENILDFLKENKVFEILKNEDRFVFVERCDSYFGVELTRSEVTRLINELQELLDKN